MLQTYRRNVILPNYHPPPPPTCGVRNDRKLCPPLLGSKKSYRKFFWEFFRVSPTHLVKCFTESTKYNSSVASYAPSVSSPSSSSLVGECYSQDSGNRELNKVPVATLKLPIFKHGSLDLNLAGGVFTFYTVQIQSYLASWCSIHLVH